MALDSAKNFSKVTVSTGYDAAALSVVLTTGHGTKLPAAPFNVVWWNSTTYSDPSDDPNVEICRVTVIATDTLTITRAQEGTSASTKNTGGSVYKMIAGLTAKVINTDIFAQADTYYYPLSTNPAGYLTSGSLPAQLWTEASGTLYPTTTTDRVLIGGAVDDGVSTLYVNGGITATNGLFDLNYVSSVDAIGHTLQTTYMSGPQTMIDWSGGINSTASLSFNGLNPVFSNIIEDYSDGSYSVDTNNRILVSKNGFNAINWYNDDGFTTPTLLLGNMGATAGDGVTPVQMFGNAVIYGGVIVDASQTITSIDTNNRQLYADYGGAVPIIDWTGTANALFPLSFQIGTPGSGLGRVLIAGATDDGTSALQVNGVISNTTMPTADPADGKGTLWCDTTNSLGNGARIIYLGT